MLDWSYLKALALHKCESKLKFVLTKIEHSGTGENAGY